MNLYDLLELWHKQSMCLADGMITKQDYAEWRYNCPASQATLEQAARDKRRKNQAPIDEDQTSNKPPEHSMIIWASRWPSPTRAVYLPEGAIVRLRRPVR